MNCDRIKELLPFIDDGSLEQEVVDEVREHMNNCPSCKKEYDEIQNVVSAVRSVFLNDIHDNSQKILEGVQEKIHSQKKHNEFYWHVLPAAAVILLTVSLAFYIFIPNNANNFMTQPPAGSELTDNELMDYIAEYHLDAYELYELVEEVEEVDEYDLREALFLHEYFSISVDDIIETLDYDELDELLVSVYN